MGESGTGTPFRQASGHPTRLRREAKVEVDSKTRYEPDPDFSPPPDDAPPP
jgi:hypothetical protein